MLTPNGQSGDKTDKVSLLNMWAKTLEEEGHLSPDKPVIYAGMGKPTYHVNLYIIEMLIKFWQEYAELIKQTLAIYESTGSYKTGKKSLAIDYSDMRGDPVARTWMAEAMSTWYESSINKDNILFTVGGAGALRIIFETFNQLYKDTKKYRVITPVPYYSLYADNEKHILHTIDVMKEPGYRLSAIALEDSIKSAYQLAQNDHYPPKTVLICNPSNPLGTVITEDEWKQIAEVLRQYPDLKIVIDEAYAEMYWSSSKIPSFLNIAPDLKNRTMILRSATKALSAAGERMAMLIAFDPELMNSFRNQNISTIGHAPLSAQLAYAYGMKNFDAKEQKALKDYYLPKVEYVRERVQQMGASMPDLSYKIDGTFYVLCDFSDLLGEDIPEEAKRALNKSGKIITSEELIYSLLFKEKLMVAAGSFFGLPMKNGFIRITCSGPDLELEDMMNRLENCLLQARQRKADLLLQKISTQLGWLKDDNTEKKEQYITELKKIMKNNGSVLELKKQNTDLAQLLVDITKTMQQTSSFDTDKLNASLIIKSFLTTHQKYSQRVALEKKEWQKFVNDHFTDGSLKKYFLGLSEADKKTYKPWLKHLKKLDLDVSSPTVTPREPIKINKMG